MNTHNNPHNLIIGRSYIMRYKDNDDWGRVQITRFTDAGFPWGVGMDKNGHKFEGIITPVWEIQYEVDNMAAEMFKALYELLYLKVHANTLGKDSYYRKHKEEAWNNANAAATKYMKHFLFPTPPPPPAAKGQAFQNGEFKTNDPGVMEQMDNNPYNRDKRNGDQDNNIQHVSLM